MKKLKELYSSPTTEFFEVRFEGNFTASPTYAQEGKAGEDEEYYEYEEDF